MDLRGSDISRKGSTQKNPTLDLEHMAGRGGEAVRWLTIYLIERVENRRECRVC
jgi:hypothetical protein